jgi:hypothetical protein
MIRYIRRLVYRLGFRPKPGSIFYSPSLTLTVGLKDFPINTCDDMVYKYENLREDIRAFSWTSEDVRKMQMNIEPRNTMPAYQNDGLNVTVFYCPKCGGPLEFGSHFYCVHHGVVIVAMVHNKVTMTMKDEDAV